MRRHALAMLVLFACVVPACAPAPVARGPLPRNARMPRDDGERRFWLTNMVRYHGFTREEIRLATGYRDDEIDRYLREYRLDPDAGPPPPADGKVVVMPYPGGRNPRIGDIAN